MPVVLRWACGRGVEVGGCHSSLHVSKFLLGWKCQWQKLTEVKHPVTLSLGWKNRELVSDTRT